MSTEFYPSLPRYLNLDALPEEFSFLTSSLNDFLDDIKLSQVQISKSPNFSVINYYVVIRSSRKIGFDLPGTGFSLILNPDFDPSTPGYFSEFPLSLSVDLPIL